MTYVRGTQSFASATILGEEWPGLALVEPKWDPVDPAGGAVQYTVDDSPAVPLDPPTAGAWKANLRVAQTTGSGGALYYRTDGTTVTSANAFGFLRDGDFLPVQLSDFTDFSMIASSGAVFQAYVEWVNPTTP